MSPVWLGSDTLARVQRDHTYLWRREMTAEMSFLIYKMEETTRPILLGCFED